MRLTWHKLFREDTRAMEEIGFIYVFGLSVILLSSIFYTVSESTSTEKERATIGYLENEAQRVAGVLQNVIDLQLTNPGMNHTRLLHLGHEERIYQYRIVFTLNMVTLISRYEDISTSTKIYNPTDIGIDANIQSDASAITFHYDPTEHRMLITMVDPDRAFD